MLILNTYRGSPMRQMTKGCKETSIKVIMVMVTLDMALHFGVGCHCKQAFSFFFNNNIFLLYYVSHHTEHP